MSQEPQGKMDFDSDFGNSDQNKLLKRPWVAFFHFFFRVSALTVYLFGTLFSGSFMGIFVSVILLLSLDFWTVKNVSGRIMVKLHFKKMLNLTSFFCRLDCVGGITSTNLETQNGTLNPETEHQPWTPWRPISVERPMQGYFG